MTSVDLINTNTAKLAPNQGSAVIRPQGLVGPSGPGGSDSGVASYIADLFSLTRAALSGMFSRLPGYALRYVDPVNGSDTNNGKSWGGAFATVAAAVAALPSTGGTIRLAGGDCDFGTTGLVLDPRKPITFEAAHRPERRYATSLSPRFTSTAGTKPDYLVSIDDRAFGLPGATNYFGFTFIGINFDANACNLGGIRGYNLCMTLVEDCAFISYDGTYTPGKYLAIAERLPSGGVAPDNSWWRVRENLVRKAGLFRTIGSGSNNAVVRDNVCWGSGLNDGTETPMVWLDGSGGTLGARSVITGNNFEQTWIGVRCDGTVGTYIFGNGGESINYRAVLLTDCIEATVQQTWNTGTFQAGYYDVEDIRGQRNNIDGGSRGVKITDPVDGVNVRDGHGVGPALMHPGAFSVIRGNNTGSNPFGAYMGPDTLDAFARTGLTMQYTTDSGATWPDFGADTNILLAANGSNITIPTGKRRFRIKNTSALSGVSAGLLVLRFAAASITAGYTVKVTEYGSDGTTVLRTSTCKVSANPTSASGLAFATSHSAHYVEAEVNLPDDGTAASMWRASLIVPVTDDTYFSRRLVSGLTPNGNVTGRVGDECQVVSSSSPGVWTKLSGNNTNTGWVKNATTSDIPAASSPGVYSATATATLSNSTTETVLDSYTIPAASAAAGTSFRLEAGGQTDNIATSGTLTFRLRIGGVAGTVLGQWVEASGGSAVTGRAWHLNALVTIRSTGTTGRAAGAGLFTGALAANPGLLTSTMAPASNVDTTANQDLVLTAQWATADLGNVLRREVAAIELAKA